MISWMIDISSFSRLEYIIKVKSVGFGFVVKTGGAPW